MTSKIKVMLIFLIITRTRMNSLINFQSEDFVFLRRRSCRLGLSFFPCLLELSMAASTRNEKGTHVAK